MILDRRKVYFEYLEHLNRESIDMRHAGEILQEVFGLPEQEVQRILIDWMRSKENK